MTIMKSSLSKARSCRAKTVKLSGRAGLVRSLTSSEMNMMMKRARIKNLVSIGLATGIFLEQSTPCWAADSDAFQFFQEEAKVVTASRREQSISEAPVAIDVITSDEIKASGAVNLWDLLRYRAGVNVIDGHPTTSANRAIVSIRGFGEEFSRNVLVLVDGRSVYSADSGGTFWAQLPVQIQDIERIEIIRGPNAALYGSGAGLGVINIITKKPSSDTSLALDERGGNRGTVQSYESINASLKQFAYRLSHTYLQQGGFDGTNGDQPANDSFHTNKANFRSHWNPAEGTELELFAGGSLNNNGLEDVSNSQDHFDQHFEMLKLSQKVGDNSSVQLLSSRNDYTSDIASLNVITEDIRSYEYDEQVLHQIDWADGRMKSTYGFDYKSARSESQQIYPGVPYVESQTYRGYFNQTARITPHVLWVGAFSWDASDTGKPQPNYQLSHLWEPVENHSFRVSYSVAHTVPTLNLLDIMRQTPGSPTFIGNPNLLPETITGYETGYRGYWLGHHLSVDSDLFYNVVDNKDENVFSSDFSQATFVNINKAISRGAELSLKYVFTLKRSVYVNYTYEHITDTFGNTGEVSENTPEHALNIGGMTDLGHGFTGSFNLGYKDNYFISFQQYSQAVPAYWRLDARLAYALPWYKDAELYVAGQNLAVSSHQEFADSLYVPRTYQVGITMKWGGAVRER